MKNNNFAKAKVVYEDIDNQNQQVSFHNISGALNSLINLNHYKRYIPNGYKFEGYGHFNQHLKDHDTDVIYVRQDPNDVKQGRIMVDYINSNSQLIHHSMFTGNIGDVFSSDQYKSDVPKHYRFSQILTGKNVSNFKSGSQIMIIQVTKIHYVHITIEYLCNNKLVDKDQVKGALGTAFNINQYTHNIPTGYKFEKVNGNVPKTFQHNQIIEIDVASNRISSNKPIDKSVQTVNKTSSNSRDSRDVDVGKVLIKLAASLRALGLTISKGHQL